MYEVKQMPIFETTQTVCCTDTTRLEILVDFVQLVTVRVSEQARQSAFTIQGITWARTAQSV